MKNENNYEIMVFFYMMFLCTMSSCLWSDNLRYEIIAPPLQMGIISLPLIIYMKIQGKLPKYLAFMFTSLGIVSILTWLAKCGYITTGNYDYYEYLMNVVYLILMDVMLIVMLIDIYKNGTAQEFIEIRNKGLVFVIISTIIFMVL